jgi:hypothetical protein
MFKILERNMLAHLGVFLFCAQRAKDQIKIHADIPTFKNFIQEECEKVHQTM